MKKQLLADEELGLFLCINSSIEEGYCTDISLGSSVFFETLFSIFNISGVFYAHPD